MLKRMLPVFFLLLFKCSYGQFQELEGLAFESPDSIQVKNKNFFNDNNWIYQVGREFIFSYTIIKKWRYPSLPGNKTGRPGYRQLDFCKSRE